VSRTAAAILVLLGSHLGRWSFHRGFRADGKARVRLDRGRAVRPVRNRRRLPRAGRGSVL